MIVKNKSLTGEWIESYTGMEFVRIEKGCYEMGCGNWQINCSDDEKPPHEVCVEGFWIGKYEVTQGQWEMVMGSNPSDYQAGQDYPVEMISWYDAQTFVKRLNDVNGEEKIFRLPSEAEWEYAARSGGREEIYAGGNSSEDGLWAPVYWQPVRPTYPQGQTFSVGSAKPNGLGLYDMSGNVIEWCQDWYDKKYYKRSPVNNPRGPESGEYKVSRGGHRDQDIRLHNLRTTSRKNHPQPAYFDFALGMRLVADEPGR